MPDEPMVDANVPDSSAGDLQDITLDAPETPDQQAPPAEEPLPFHNHPRWKEVQEQLKSYKQYGDPQTVAARMQVADQLERQIYQNWQAQQQARQRLSQPPANATQYTPEEQEVRNYMMKLLPEYQNLVHQSQYLTEAIEQQKLVTVIRGQGMVTNYAKEVGLSNPAAAVTIENALTAMIENSKPHLLRFKAGDLSVIDEAWQYYKQNVIEPLRRSAVSSYTQSKQKVTGLPASSAAMGRGTPATGGKGTPDFDDPNVRADVAWALLNRKE